MTNGCEVDVGVDAGVSVSVGVPVGAGVGVGVVASEAVAGAGGCKIGLNAELPVYWPPNPKMRAPAATRTPTTTRPRTIGRMGPLDEAAGAGVPQAELLS